MDSIRAQDYPQELVEIIVADGGSTDGTLAIAEKHTDRICHNPLKTGEAGKAIGIRRARHELIAFIDSDNILPTPDWFRRMVEPFKDPQIVGAEPLEFTYRAHDGVITRYCALIGMNDPLCMFLGNYDRYNHLTRKWTGVPVSVVDCGKYLAVTLNSGRIPTIGANGFIGRRDDLLRSMVVAEYLFDVDMIYDLTLRGRNTFAKVKIGIVHLFSGDICQFVRKQRRRIKDYLYYSQAGLRRYPWRRFCKAGIFRFVLYCIIGVPLFVQSIVGYLRVRDRAWFFHPIACWITLIVYGWETIKAFFKARDRISLWAG